MFYLLIINMIMGGILVRIF